MIGEIIMIWYQLCDRYHETGPGAQTPPGVRHQIQPAEGGAREHEQGEGRAGAARRQLQRQRRQDRRERGGAAGPEGRVVGAGDGKYN